MAATHTVPQPSEHCNFIPIEPRHGVITLYGYGIDFCVDRGHLIIHDGIGSRRTTARFARIGHRIRRLVVIGSDGAVSLSALRWLADQEASFVMRKKKTARPSHLRIKRSPTSRRFWRDVHFGSSSGRFVEFHSPFRVPTSAFGLAGRSDGPERFCYIDTTPAGRC